MLHNQKLRDEPKKMFGKLKNWIKVENFIIIFHVTLAIFEDYSLDITYNYNNFFKLFYAHLK